MKLSEEFILKDFLILLAIIFVGAIFVAISPIIHWRFCYRPTEQALDSILDQIVSAQNESDNSPEKLALALKFMPKIRKASLENFIKPCTFRFKVAFLVLYRHYDLKRYKETEDIPFIGLHDLKLFLRSPELLNDFKIECIVEWACRGSRWLALAMRGFSPDGQATNEFGTLDLLINAIRDSPNIRQTLQRECSMLNKRKYPFEA
jgi:hypothetical protein